jgi:hypothetical protein
MRPCRANAKGDVFKNDVDRQDFLKTFAEACEKTAFEVHAYCLMGKHFHLLRAERRLLEQMEGKLGERSLSGGQAEELFFEGLAGKLALHGIYHFLRFIKSLQI